jgi:hypothetical protein
MNQKVKQQRFLKYLRLLHIKKVDVGSIIKARIWIRSQTSESGSDPKGPGPTGSGSATLSAVFYQPFNKLFLGNVFHK